MTDQKYNMLDKLIKMAKQNFDLAYIIAENHNLQKELFDSLRKGYDIDINLLRKLMFDDFCDDVYPDICYNMTECFYRGKMINFSDKPKLELLNIAFNDYTTLNITSNLKILICHSNNIKSLNTTNLPNLESLICNANNITNLNLLSNKKLVSLHCNHNYLKRLNLNNPYLQKIFCQSNQLEEITIPKSVTTLICYNNLIKVLVVSKNENLIHLSCGDNPITSLDVSKNIKLKHLKIDNTKIVSLDLSNNIELQTLECYSTNIIELDLRNNINLEELNIIDNHCLKKVFLNNKLDGKITIQSEYHTIIEYC